MIKRVLVCFFFVFSNYSLVWGHDVNKDTACEKLISDLQWVFEKGLPLYHSGTESEEIRKRYEKMNSGASMYSKIHETQGGSQTRFWIDRTERIPSKKEDELIRKRWDVRRYAVDIQESVLEYWVVSIIDRSISTGIGCLFIITQADSLQSSRKIVIQETQYFPSAVVGNQTIQFPEDDLEVLYSLQPFRYPMSFRDSDLKDYVVYIKKDGTPYLKKIGFFDRLRINIYWGKPPKS
ncbi:MAG: hypothetical protein LBH44_13960 [Treponema sp.]|jgi:hypothetical protein|nr:hypothetical protein [Treponema sp.]